MVQGLTIRVWESGDVVFCRLTIPFKPHIGGAISLLVSVDSRKVLEKLRKAGFRFAQGEHVGSFFGAIGKALKKVTKLPLIKQAVGMGKALINSPIGNFVAPGASLAIKAASGAAKLLAAKKSKDPARRKKAEVAIKAAQAQAKAETKAGKQLPLPKAIAAKPSTAAAFRYLVTVERAAA